MPRPLCTNPEGILSSMHTQYIIYVKVSGMPELEPNPSLEKTLANWLYYTSASSLLEYQAQRVPVRLHALNTNSQKLYCCLTEVSVCSWVGSPLNHLLKVLHLRVCVAFILIIALQLIFQQIDVKDTKKKMCKRQLSGWENRFWNKNLTCFEVWFCHLVVLNKLFPFSIIILTSLWVTDL